MSNVINLYQSKDPSFLVTVTKQNGDREYYERTADNSIDLVMDALEECDGIVKVSVMKLGVK
jgi:hypothetical protein